ncbi:MAG: efflux RND transporter periplasmic adaptor subunit [Planctomycetaceae bacterium]|nr:efflux RND transporter periplasmic adaptor subunit [Planctomycetaceae bacterium]
MNRSAVLPVIAVVAFTFMAWHLLQTNQSAPLASPPVEPSRSPYGETIAGAGLIEPRSENIEVAAVVPGTVTEVFVKVGETVRAGAPLFRLDDRQRKAELAVQQARLAEARSQLRRMEQMPRVEDVPPSAARVQKAEADLKARKDDMDRLENLVARKVSTQQEWIQAEQAFLAARALSEQAHAEHAKLLAGAWEEDLAVTQAQVKLAQEGVTQAEIEVQRLVVTAPIDGAVLKVDVRPGEYVGTPPGQPLIVLGDTQVLHVRVDIDEQDLPRFRPGLPGKGFVRGDAQTALAMSFVRVEPYVEPKRSLTNKGNERVDTRVLQVIYALEPGEQTVYVGQQIDVFLDGTVLATP